MASDYDGGEKITHLDEETMLRLTQGLSTHVPKIEGMVTGLAKIKKCVDLKQANCTLTNTEAEGVLLAIQSLQERKKTT